MNPLFDANHGLDWAPEVIGPYASSSDSNVQWEINEKERLLDVRFTAADRRGFFALSSTTPLDLSAFSGYDLSLTFRVLDFGAGAAVAPETNALSLRLECTWPCSSHSHRFEVPALNTWQTVTIPMERLVEQGLDLSRVSNGFMLIPTQANTQGLHLQIQSIALTAPQAARNSRYTIGLELRRDDQRFLEENFNSTDLSPWSLSFDSTDPRAAQIFANEGPEMVIDWRNIRGDVRLIRPVNLSIYYPAVSLQLAQMAEGLEIAEARVYLRDTLNNEWLSPPVALPQGKDWQEVFLLDGTQMPDGIKLSSITHVGLVFPRPANRLSSYFRLDTLRVASNLPSNEPHYSQPSAYFDGFTQQLFGSPKGFDWGTAAPFEQSTPERHVQWQETATWQSRAIEIRFNQANVQGEFQIAGLTSNLMENQNDQLSFLVRVMNPGRAADATGRMVPLMVRLDCGYPCSGDVRKIQVAADGTWHRFVFSLSDMAKTGLDLTRVNGFILMPESPLQEGLVLQLDSLQLERYKWPPVPQENTPWREDFNSFDRSAWVLNAPSSTRAFLWTTVGQGVGCANCKAGDVLRLATRLGGLNLRGATFKGYIKLVSSYASQGLAPQVALELTDASGRKLRLPAFALSPQVDTLHEVTVSLNIRYPDFNVAQVADMAFVITTQSDADGLLNDSPLFEPVQRLVFDTLRWIKP